MQRYTNDTTLSTSIVSISTATVVYTSRLTSNRDRISSVFGQTNRTCVSSSIPSPQSHTRFSTLILAHRPVSIFRWWELRRNFVNARRSRSLMYFLLVYAGWSFSCGLISLYVVAFDPVSFANFCCIDGSSSAVGAIKSLMNLYPVVCFCSHILYIRRSGVCSCCIPRKDI